MRILTTLWLSGLMAAGFLASAGTASASALPNVSVQQCIAGGGVPDYFYDACRGGRYNGQPLNY